MRTLQRVMFATVISTGVAVAALPGFAQAQQKFPSNPIRLVIPSAPGGFPDIPARMVGQKMSESWKQPCGGKPSRSDASGHERTAARRRIPGMNWQARGVRSCFLPHTISPRIDGVKRQDLTPSPLTPSPLRAIRRGGAVERRDVMDLQAHAVQSTTTVPRFGASSTAACASAVRANG